MLYEANTPEEKLSAFQYTYENVPGYRQKYQTFEEFLAGEGLEKSLKPEPAPKEEPGVLGYVKEYGKAIGSGLSAAVGDVLPETAARVWRGGEYMGEASGLDRYIKQQTEEARQSIDPLREDMSVFGMTSKDVGRSLSQIGFSLPGMAAGLGAGAFTGPIGAAAAGGTAGAATGYLAAKDQLVEMAVDDFLQKNPAAGPDQVAAFRQSIEDEARKYGTAEALWEGVGQAVTAGLLKLPAGKLLERIGVPGKVAKYAGFPAKTALDVGVELGGEGQTQVDQGGVEYRLGLRDTPPPANFIEGAGEVWKDVVPMQAFMMGMGGAVNRLGERAKQRQQDRIQAEADALRAAEGARLAKVAQAQQNAEDFQAFQGSMGGNAPDEQTAWIDVLSQARQKSQADRLANAAPFEGLDSEDPAAKAGDSTKRLGMAQTAQSDEWLNLLRGGVQDYADPRLDAALGALRQQEENRFARGLPMLRPETLPDTMPAPEQQMALEGQQRAALPAGEPGAPMLPYGGQDFGLVADVDRNDRVPARLADSPAMPARGLPIESVRPQAAPQDAAPFQAMQDVADQTYVDQRVPGVTDLGEMPLSERLAPAAAGGDRLEALAKAGKVKPSTPTPAINVRADGSPYTERSVNLQVAARIKRGQNVEAVQIGKNAWGWREVEQPGKAGRIYGDAVYQLRQGDRLKDASGKEYAFWSQRHGVMEVHPVENGKPVINADSGVRVNVDDMAKARNQEYRSDDFFLATKPARPALPSDNLDASEKKALDIWRKDEIKHLNATPPVDPVYNNVRGRIDASTVSPSERKQLNAKFGQSIWAKKGTGLPLDVLEQEMELSPELGAVLRSDSGGDNLFTYLVDKAKPNKLKHQEAVRAIDEEYERIAQSILDENGPEAERESRAQAGEDAASHGPQEAAPGSDQEAGRGRDAGPGGVAWDDDDVTRVFGPADDTPAPARREAPKAQEQAGEQAEQPLFSLVSHGDLDKAQRRAFDNQLKKAENGGTLSRLLKKFLGTPWEKQATSGLLVRQAMDDTLAGKTPDFESSLDSKAVKSVREAAARGEKALWAVIERNGLVGHPTKPVNSVNSSLANCEPSRLCAKYCYASSGNYVYDNNIVNGEMTDWAVRTDPVRAAKIASRTYKSMPEFQLNKALRIFDKGDGGAHWLEFIREMNAQGVRVQVFSKKPEFLAQVNPMNARLLSIDSSNAEIASKDKSLPLALVYGSTNDLALLERHKARFQEHGGVVLPVKIGRNLLNKEAIDVLPAWAKKYACPADRGVVEIKSKTNPEGWTCTRCDKNGGLGCFFGRVTEKVMQAEAPLSNRVERLAGLMNEIRSIKDGPTEDQQRSLLAELDLLVSEVRRGFDPDTASGESPPPRGDHAVAGGRGEPSLKRGAPEGYKPANPLNRKALDGFLAGMSRAAPGSAPSISYDDHAEARRYNPGVNIPADARGFYLNGEMHVIADMFGSKQELVEFWVHEQQRHHGFRVYLGKDYQATMQRAWVNRDVRAKALELFKQGYTDLKVFKRDGERIMLNREASARDIAHAADEAIAHLADGGWKSSIMDRIITAVRKFLRRAGMDLDMSNAEIRRMISASAQTVMDGRARSWAGDVGRAMEPAFQRVFHGSPHRERQNEENPALDATPERNATSSAPDTPGDARLFGGVVPGAGRPVLGEEGGEDLVGRVPGGDGPSYKRAAQAVTDPALVAGLKGNLRNDLRGWQKALSLPHWIAKQFPAFAKMYDRQMARVDERMTKVHNAMEAARSFYELPKTSLEEARKIIWAIDGQKIEGLGSWMKDDGTLDNGRKRLALNEEHYAALEDHLKKEYGASDKVAKSVADVRRALDSGWIELHNKFAAKKEAQDTDIATLRSQMGKIHNYFPHKRYGDYYVKATDADGKTVYREHFDMLFASTDEKRKLGTAALKKRAEAMVAKLSEKYPGYSWEYGDTAKLPEAVYEYPIPVDALQQIVNAGVDKLPADQRKDVEKALEQAFADVLKERGFGANFIQRQNIPGHETQDVRRVFHDHLMGLHGFLTKMDAARDFVASMRDIDAKTEPRLYEYSQRFMQDMLQNAGKVDQAVAAMKAVGFVKYLGLRLPTAALNLTQNMISGIPTLSMHASGAAGRYFWTTAKDIVTFSKYALTGRLEKAKGLTPDEAAFLKEAYASGHTQAAFVEDMQLRVADSFGSKAIQKIMQVAGYPMAVTERFNRSTLALAAYRAARDGKIVNKKTLEKFGLAPGEQADAETAGRFARMVTDDAHFVYGKGNMPQPLRGSDMGKIASTSYQFRRFSHNMLGLYAEMMRSDRGKQAMLRHVGALVALGGLASVPLYKTVMAAIMAATGDDGEEELRKMGLGDIAIYGLPSLAGVSFSGSMGLDLPVVSEMSDKKNNPIWDILGIPGAFVRETQTSIAAMKAGRVDRAIATSPLTPSIFRNAANALRLEEEGAHTLSGRPIPKPGEKQAMKLTKEQTWAKILGFAPLELTKAWQVSESLTAQKEFVDDAKRSFANRYVNALNKGDKDEARRVRDAVREWNNKATKEKKRHMLIDLRAAVQYRQRAVEPSKAFQGRAKEMMAARQ